MLLLLMRNQTYSKPRGCVVERTRAWTRSWGRSGGSFAVVKGRSRRRRSGRRNKNRGNRGNGFGGGVEIGARAALEVFGGGAGRVGSGENGVAEGATEFHRFGESRFGVVNQQRLEVRPVPCAFTLYRFVSNHQKPLVALLRRLRRRLVRGSGRVRRRHAGVRRRHCEWQWRTNESVIKKGRSRFTITILRHRRRRRDPGERAFSRSVAGIRISGDSP